MSIIKTVLASFAQKMENGCQSCNGKLVRKSDKYGDFIGCENFPDCRYAISLSQYKKLKHEGQRILEQRIVDVPLARKQHEKSNKKIASEKVDEEDQEKHVTLENKLSRSIEELMKEDIWTPEETGVYLKFSKQKLQQMRKLSTGPKFIRFGRHIRYEKKTVLQWIEEMKKRGI